MKRDMKLVLQHTTKVLTPYLPVNKFAKLTNLVVGVETVKGTSLMKMMRRGTSRLKASPADRIQIAVQ